MDAQTVLQMLGSVVVAGAAYGAVRADLKAMHERIARSETRGDALETRFNTHIEKGLTHGKEA